MNIYFFVLGVLLVLFALYDLTYTTLAPKGAGIITRKVSSWLWRISLFISGKYGRTFFLSNIGYLLLYVILLIWILMIWAGNTLIIYSDKDALMDPDKQLVTSFIDKTYYIGYVLSTMGSGEYHPLKPGWKVYAALISFTGLVFITIAISYIIPVINAVAEKRSLANYIAGMGKNPFQIIEKAYDGHGFKKLEDHFQYLIPEILKLTKNHQAYPALHYFHENKLVDSSCINLSSLDEVISILLCTVEENKRPKDSVVMPLRHSMTLFLQTLHGAYLNPKEDEPEFPDYNRLAEIIPANKSQDYFRNNFSQLNKRRRIILAYLNHHGWKWKDMYEADYNLEFEE